MMPRSVLGVVASWCLGLVATSSHVGWWGGRATLSLAEALVPFPGSWVRRTGDEIMSAVLNHRLEEWRRDSSLRLVLFRLVGPPLKPIEVRLFLGARCMVPQPYAAWGNRSYPGVLGHNRWPAVPRVNYPDIVLAVGTFGTKPCQRPLSSLQEISGCRVLNLKYQILCYRNGRVLWRSSAFSLNWSK
jgi:hypothetical protein